ncbi:MAG: LysR family transcriptional regulator substrate-binding protein, partial [Sandaracinobacteroides sp.]
FGGPLFRRERALTHLTELGKLMHPYLERSHEAAQQARALARRVERSELQPLSVGIADDVMLDGLPGLIAALNSAFPGFELTLTQADARQLAERALEGEFDAIIGGFETDLPERLDRWELLLEHYVLLVPEADPAGLAEGCSPERLAAVPRVGRDCAAEQQLLRAVPGLSAPRHKAGTAQAAALMATAGLGAALLPRSLSRAPATLVVELGDLAPWRAVSLAIVAGRQRSPAADAFMKSARARTWV